MKNLIRPVYPKEFSIGLLLLIFVTACFLAHQIFVVPIHDLKENKDIYVGMVLVSIAVIIMILIMWEEILFPIRLKEIEGGIIFRNRQRKLRIQVIMYCCIPVIFIYVYFQYEVKLVRFIAWAAVCMLPPVMDKIISGVNNYEDFLKLTNTSVEYKNNEKEGRFPIEDIMTITIVKDDRNVISKLQLLLKNTSIVTIDLDEMELEVFYDSINMFLSTKYKDLLK